MKGHFSVFVYVYTTTYPILPFVKVHVHDLYLYNGSLS